ncbi:hypothetical protein CBS101457_001039 [Exobasidium rhododendri]|nr:hypothetical protein CBS101457_001039 [Exobasidium rhododendri]
MLVTKTEQTREKAESHAVASASSPPQSHAGTITSALAAEPTLAPSKAAKRLFPNPPAWKRAILRFKIKEELEEGRGKKWNWHKGAVHKTNIEPNEGELQSVRAQYGYKSEAEGGPKKLYIMILADALLPLPRNPMSGVVSPPLLATTGIAPFSVFSTGPDIIQHYHDCIVAAKEEVILLTNYWQGGKNVERIADALRVLDRKHAERRQERLLKEQKSEGEAVGQDKETEKAVLRPSKPTLQEQIIVKLMWDRGPQTLADLFRLRKPVPPNMWKENGLPTMDEIPNLNVEIINYHRPLMGTFHAKLLLVDRQVALINSNNIQDRPNIESCTRLEGDIVNSVYDHALISWGNSLNPPLPCLGSPAPKIPSPAAFSIGAADSTLPNITASKLRELANVARKKLQEDNEETEDIQERSRDHWIGGQRKLSFADVVDGVRHRGHAGATVAPNSTHTSAMNGFHVEEKGELDSSAEVDRAARNAGVDWARKVLGERFHPSSSHLTSADSSPTSTLVNDHSGSATQNKRHFADVVSGLMEKEGIKPALWAEGALDTFGLGPSSRRNVSDEAKRSKGVARQGTMQIPDVVLEEEKGDRPEDLGHEGESERRSESTHSNAITSLPPSSNSALDTSVATVIAADDDDADEEGTKQHHLDSSAPTSEDSGQEKTSLINGSKAPLGPNSGGGRQGAPGAQAYQQRHRRTLSTLSKASASERLAQITKSLDFANLSQVKGEITAEQLAAMKIKLGQDAQAALDDGTDVLLFNPYIFHAHHQPVPMALVNRRPHGTPGHSDIRNPQDAAWLAGFRYAKKHIFLQTPTLNATPIKHAILHAARRHVRIEAYLGLGFNDKSESMPFQGGTNESVVTKLYRQLRREGRGDEKYLEVYWYTGKDMTRPLNAVRKQRNCHVKYISFDGQVAITGSGNMDTQSWFHSQEINVMVDSAQIVAEWDAGLKKNQSTGLYGRVDSDGIWRGKTGSERVDKGGDT